MKCYKMLSFHLNDILVQNVSSALYLRNLVLREVKYKVTTASTDPENFPCGGGGCPVIIKFAGGEGLSKGNMNFPGGGARSAHTH